MQEKHTFFRPLDYEELPFPKSQAPALISGMVQSLPDCWQQTSALALLPSLSVACGGVTYGKNAKPLAFQIAVYGLAGSGKTQFTCRPAQVVQSILSARDDLARAEVKGQVQDCPKVMGFEISTVMLAKYLQHAGNQTVMLYTDEISSAVGSDKGGNAFMQLHSILRKGYDGTAHTMDYKEKDSFRGCISPRLSFLACGTPHAVFNYFNNKAVEEGSTRRVIFVEHPYHEQHVEELAYSIESKEALEHELYYLQSQSGNLDLDAVEKAVLQWKEQKAAACGDDRVAKLMINTPADIFRRATYLAYVLNHYEQLGNAIFFGRWVAEYALRCAMNLTYSTQKEIEKIDEKIFSTSSAEYHSHFNEQMLASLPETFSFQDVVNYRKAHTEYSGDKCSPSIISRWKDRGKIKQIQKAIKNVQPALYQKIAN